MFSASSKGEKMADCMLNSCTSHFLNSTSTISKDKEPVFPFFAPFECVESETKDDQAHFTMSCKSCVAHCTPAFFYASRPYKWCLAQRQMKQNTKNNLTVHPKWHSCLLSAQRQCTQTSLYKQPTKRVGGKQSPMRNHT